MLLEYGVICLLSMKILFTIFAIFVDVFSVESCHLKNAVLFKLNCKFIVWAKEIVSYLHKIGGSLTMIR